MSGRDGGPAFPVEGQYDAYEDQTHLGMSLRDWFAGQALAGLLATDFSHLKAADIHASGGMARVTARAAYEAADAMLTARKAGAE